MQGSAVSNIRTFRALCGDDFSSRILLCTTFWDLYEHQPKIANERLEELKQDDFWGEMIKNGSDICRVPEDQSELQKIISALASQRAIPLKIQDEVVDQGKPIDESAAMLSLLEAERLRQEQEHQKKMDEAKAEHEEHLRLRQKEMAEQFERMQQQFEEKLRVQREENEKTAAELERRMSEQATQSSKTRKPPLPPRRAQTDMKPTLHQVAQIRRQKVEKFAKAIASAVNVLETGKKNGHVKCDINASKPWYTTFCDSCLMTIGGQEHYGELLRKQLSEDLLRGVRRMRELHRKLAYWAIHSLPALLQC